MAKKSKKVTKKAATSSSTSTRTPANNKRKNDEVSDCASKKLKGAPSSATSPPTNTNGYLPSIRTPQHHMEDIVGLQDVKDKIIRSIIDPFRMDQKNAEFLKINQPKGILFLGPPGCGKTALADAIVNSLREKGTNVQYYTETGGCLSQWLGESERNLRNLFETAHANSPAVIFLDEIDGLGCTRENRTPGETTTRLTTLLTEINDVKRGQVLLIAATNQQKLVDQALIRPGRFDATIQISLPNDQDRGQILQHFVQKTKMEIKANDMLKIVQETRNWSGAKLESFVNELYLYKLKKACPNFASLNLMALKKALKSPLVVDLESDITPLLTEMREN